MILGLYNGRNPIVISGNHGLADMNTKERNELLELASRLDRRAKGKRAHARNLRNSAKADRNCAEQIDSSDESEFISELRHTSFGEFFGIGQGGDKRRAKRADLMEAVSRREKEANEADAKAAELEAAAEQAMMRAAREG